MNTKYVTQIKCLKPKIVHKEKMRNSEGVSNYTKECPPAKQLKEAVALQSRMVGNAARAKTREGHLLFSETFLFLKLVSVLLYATKHKPMCYHWIIGRKVYNK